MKKKILAAATAAVMITSAVPMVNAETTEKQINVMLNGDYVSFTQQAPANINDRVLVPIRDVMEKMGAKVDWNDADQSITVTRDDVTVGLKVNDANITVNNETKTLDVAPQIINDKTLLPIRAVAEAFGCTVGWDDDAKTVIIVNVDDYLNEIKKNSSNFYTFASEQSSMLADMYSSTMTGSFKIKVESKTEGKADDFDLGFDISSEGTSKNDNNEDKTVIKINAGSLTKILKDLGIEIGDVDLSKLDEVNLETKVIGKDIYVKTDLVKKLTEVTSDKKVAAAAVLVTENTWLKIDIESLIKSIPDAEGADQFADYIDAVASAAQDGKNVIESIADFAKGMEYNSIVTAEMVNSVAETFSGMYNDNNFKYSKTDDGYTVSFTMTNDQYVDYVKAQWESEGIQMPENALDGLDINMSMNVTGDKNGNSKSDVDMTYKVNSKIDDDNYVNMDMSFKINAETKAVDSADDVTAPEGAIDLSKLLDIMK